jgi:hypothetical protein
MIRGVDRRTIEATADESTEVQTIAVAEEDDARRLKRISSERTI